LHITKRVVLCFFVYVLTGIPLIVWVDIITFTSKAWWYCDVCVIMHLRQSSYDVTGNCGYIDYI